MINSFRGKYYFLSNFSDSKITINNLTFDNAEAAFHSYKDIERQADFVNLSASLAKKKGRHVKLRGDWEFVKDDIMYHIVKAKFEQNEDLKQKLIETGNEELIESNNWHDHYWGVCQGRGNNKLGKILMRVRQELTC